MSHKKIALINARIKNPLDDAQAIQNILLINGKVMGLGYTPDDDEGTEIHDLKGCVIEAKTPIVLLKSPTFDVRDLKTGRIVLSVFQGEINQ